MEDHCPEIVLHLNSYFSARETAITLQYDKRTKLLLPYWTLFSLQLLTVAVSIFPYNYAHNSCSLCQHMLLCFYLLLCSKLCQHNSPRPINRQCDCNNYNICSVYFPQKLAYVPRLYSMWQSHVENQFIPMSISIASLRSSAVSPNFH